MCGAGLMADLAVETWLRFLVWRVVGLAVYWSYGRRRADLARTGDVDAAERAG